jgi:hypothetical protein
MAASVEPRFDSLLPNDLIPIYLTQNVLSSTPTFTMRGHIYISLKVLK